MTTKTKAVASSNDAGTVVSRRRVEPSKRSPVAKPEARTFVDFTVYGTIGRNESVLGSVASFADVDALKADHISTCRRAGYPAPKFRVIERDYDSERDEQMIESEVE
jgi:hypothetical protein